MYRGCLHLKWHLLCKVPPKNDMASSYSSGFTHLQLELLQTATDPKNWQKIYDIKHVFICDDLQCDG